MRPIFLFLMLMLLSSCSKEGKVTSVPRCPCEMYVPDGFEQAPELPGFQHPTDGAAIKVTRQQESYFGLSRAIDVDVLKASGMTLLKKEKIPGRDQAMYYQLVQESEGKRYLGHMVLIGDDEKTYIVNAIFPELLDRKWGEELKKSVFSVSCKDVLKLEEPPAVRDR